jgi:hypothetical protein
MKRDATGCSGAGRVTGPRDAGAARWLDGAAPSPATGGTAHPPAHARSQGRSSAGSDACPHTASITRLDLRRKLPSVAQRAPRASLDLPLESQSLDLSATGGMPPVCHRLDRPSPPAHLPQLRFC